MKAGRKPKDVLRTRNRLNAGRFSAYELAWVMGVSYETVMSQAKRMGLSLRVRGWDAEDHKLAGNDGKVRVMPIRGEWGRGVEE